MLPTACVTADFDSRFVTADLLQMGTELGTCEPACCRVVCHSITAICSCMTCQDIRLEAAELSRIDPALTGMFLSNAEWCLDLTGTRLCQASESDTI